MPSPIYLTYYLIRLKYILLSARLKQRRILTYRDIEDVTDGLRIHENEVHATKLLLWPSLNTVR